MNVTTIELDIVTNDGTLRCVDFGGRGTPILLLHGLCGRATEWLATASSLRRIHRVFALDQRAHGRSAKGSADLSTMAFVRDAIRTIAATGHEPVILAGQSMGGNVAYRVAAARPDLVRALVVIEAQAWGHDDADSKPTLRWLETWPVPFVSKEDGRRWFDAQGLVGSVWSDVLVECDDGWHPEFLMEDMKKIASVPPHDDRDMWTRIAMPTLVVAGELSSMTSRSTLQLMATTLLDGKFVEIPGAGHDLHLDQPTAWLTALERFVSEIQ